VRQHFAPTPEAVYIRDQTMGDNLVWLAREAYPRRKIAVWAATYHCLRNPRTVDTRIPEKWTDSVTMGHVVSEALGTQAYAVGFTAYDGEYMNFGLKEPLPMPRPPSGSLEDIWGGTGQQNAFLDLRRIAPGGEWLTEPMLSRQVSYVPMEAKWNQCLDGVIYTRTMRVRTRAG
jgi:erythromycin esterase-like protein